MLLLHTCNLLLLHCNLLLLHCYHHLRQSRLAITYPSSETYSESSYHNCQWSLSFLHFIVSILHCYYLIIAFFIHYFAYNYLACKCRILFKNLSKFMNLTIRWARSPSRIFSIRNLICDKTKILQNHPEPNKAGSRRQLDLWTSILVNYPTNRFNRMHSQIILKITK